jgi:hypothetical protein
VCPKPRHPKKKKKKKKKRERMRPVLGTLFLLAASAHARGFPPASSPIPFSNTTLYEALQFARAAYCEPARLKAWDCAACAGGIANFSAAFMFGAAGAENESDHPTSDHIGSDHLTSDQIGSDHPTSDQIGSDRTGSARSGQSSTDPSESFFYAGVSGRDRKIVVSFRGSVNIPNWIYDIDFDPVGLEPVLPGVKGGSVARALDFWLRFFFGFGFFGFFSFFHPRFELAVFVVFAAGSGRQKQT